LDIGAVVFQALWLMLPAYVANPSAQLTGGGAPLDLGRIARDGERLLGDGKTWRGLAGGVLGGFLIGGLQIAGAALVDNPSALPTFDPAGGPAGPTSFLVVLTLSLGALVGDAAKSFAKRRLRYKRGDRLPIADQYDFVVGAWVLTIVVFPVWFEQNFRIESVLVILLVTYFLHRGTSALGYRMGLKAEPW
jgi:CDP-2,3-bis-(O-geranylgeranyl)-sn-glycerol synthase